MLGLLVLSAWCLGVLNSHHRFMLSYAAPVMWNAAMIATLVIFGATGDLAKKMLFPAIYRLAQRGELDLPVVGVARSEWDDDAFRKYARESMEEFAPHGFDEAAYQAIAE